MGEFLKYIDYDHKTSFMKMLNQQRMEGDHCDVVVVVENVEFRAHRCVLAACSIYFKKLFKKQNDVDNSIVELDFIRSDIFEEVLNYMYTARLAVRKKDINLMMSSGQVLGIAFLDNLCSQKREPNMKPSRENQAPGDGMRAQDAILKELAMEEVRKNSFYDGGMEAMGSGGPHGVPPHFGGNMSKDPHSAHGWTSSSSSSSDMKLDYLLYGHRSDGVHPGMKPGGDGPKKDKSHLAHRPFACEVCPKTFTTQAHLKEHLKIHTGFKPHRCLVCGKAFIRGPDLKRHERVHSNERPFGCQMCEKAFKHKSHLRDHERQHRGERPFNCGSCEKAFIKASDLKRHWNTMHSQRRTLSPAAAAAAPGSIQGDADTQSQRDWKLEAGPHS